MGRAVQTPGGHREGVQGGTKRGVSKKGYKGRQSDVKQLWSVCLSG